jgi:hypothetical protein
MKEEIEAIEINDTRVLVDLSTGKTNIGVKWVYKTKFNEKGKVEKKKDLLNNPVLTMEKHFLQWHVSMLSEQFW